MLHITMSSEQCKLKQEWWDFPGGPLVRTLHFHCQGLGFNPWLETEIPPDHVSPPKTNKLTNKKPPTMRYHCSVLSLSHVWLCTPWTGACQVSLSFTVSQSLLTLMSIESVMLSNHLILHCPPSLPALNLSQHQDLFQWIDSSHQVAKVLELQH